MIPVYLTLSSIIFLTGLAVIPTGALILFWKLKNYAKLRIILALLWLLCCPVMIKFAMLSANLMFGQINIVQIGSTSIMK